MSYRNFRVQICLRLLLITVFLTGLIYFTMVELDGIKTFFMASFLIICLVNLFFYIDRVNSEITGFLTAILSEDYTNKYSDTKKGKSFNKMYSAFNEMNAKMNQYGVAQESQFLFINTLIRQLQTGIISIDEKERVKLINETMKKLLGVKNVVNLKDLDTRFPDLTEVIRQTKETPAKLLKITINGQLRQLSVRGSTFTIRGQYHQLVSIHDIKGELDQHEMESWHKLIRVLTHEIMNSIAPITSLSDSLHKILQQDPSAIKDPQLNEQLGTGLEAIKVRSNGLMKFTKDYRSLTRIPMPVIREVDGESFLKETIRLFETTLPASVELELRLPAQAFTLQIDANLISQAIINVLKNGLEAIAESRQKNGKIIVMVELGTQTKLLMINNGDKISEEVREKMFIPFFTSKQEGSGVGLSVVKQILQIHQAGISVDSDEEQTCFTITF